MTQEQQSFEPEDIFLEQCITDLHLIGDKPIAVCAVKKIDKKGEKYISTLWTFSLDGSDGRQLTQGPGIDDTPRWSPDGKKIAFLSDRDGGEAQLYCIQLDGGEARRLTDLKLGVQSHAWRPDGRQLLATAAVSVDPEDRSRSAATIDLDRPRRSPDEPELVWRLPYKMDGQGYQLAQRVHLMLVDAETGSATPLTQGDFDVQSAVWSSDGKQIAFIRSRGDPGQEHCTDLWLLDVDDKGAAGSPRRLSRDQANASSPSWSPDGRWIAFSGAANVGDPQMRLWLCDVKDNEVQPLGESSIEVVPGDLQWRRDSRGLAFIRAHRGLQEIAVISVPNGELKSLPRKERHIVHLAANEQLVYTTESAKEALELYCADWNGDNERKLSQFNAWWDARVAPQVHWRRFKVPDGDGGSEEIDGWLLTPAQTSGTVPLLVDVHGGPASYAPLSFSVHAYWQLLCSRGWAVLALNPVGSSSYGRKFTERLRSRWGELDLPQQTAAVEQLQAEGLVDDRIAIIGASYGGYLSAWAIGVCRHFRAAVVCAPVANLESHYGTSDSGYYADPYSMDGKPAANRELMAKLSPMMHIEKACTPTLFLQGKDDQRCPVGQSEELFVKLRRSGTPAELVLYPGGSHHVFGKGKPSHRLDALKRIVDWLQGWVEIPLEDGGKTA